MSIQGQDQNYRQGDFVNVYPHSLVICTDLPSGFLSGDEGKYWIIANRNVSIGTFLGIDQREAIEAYMAKLEAKGLNMFVAADCSMSEITSGTAAQKAMQLVSMADKLRGKGGETKQNRIVSMMCNDIFKKTSMVLYCWFFYVDNLESKKVDLQYPRRWWQFWR